MFSELFRIRNVLIIFFGVIVSATFMYSAGESFSMSSVILAGISAALVTGAGNAINDYFDSEIDKINKPKRPIPSGRITKPDVGMLSIALFLVGIGISKFINEYCLILAVLNSVILVLYARYSKKLLLISNLAISYLVTSIFLFGVAATIQEGFEFFDLKEIRIVMVITACAFLMTFSREIVKDIEDIEGDRREYAKTLPIVLGKDKAEKAAATLAAGAILFSFLPFVIHPPAFSLFVYGVLILLADTIFFLSFTMHPALGQRLMVIGMAVALVAFFLGSLMPKVI